MKKTLDNCLTRFYISFTVNGVNGLIAELKKTMKEKGFSCETMARFIGCSGKSVDRWISGESKPTPVYQKLIRKGIRKVKKL